MKQRHAQIWLLSVFLTGIFLSGCKSKAPETEGSVDGGSQVNLPITGKGEQTIEPYPLVALPVTQKDSSVQGEAYPAAVLPLIQDESTQWMTPSPAVALPLTQKEPKSGGCSPTPADALGPYYVEGAPERNKVGEGYVLTGNVLSAIDCTPLAGARIEVWMAGPNGEYGDEFRATLTSGADGSYRFESHFPPPYSGRPAHIHLMINAQGYETLITQHYPVDGTQTGNFDLVLIEQ